MLSVSILIIQILAYISGRGEANYINYMTDLAYNSFSKENCNKVVTIDNILSDKVVFWDQYIIQVPTEKLWDDEGYEIDKALLEIYDQSGKLVNMIGMPGTKMNQQQKVEGLLIDEEVSYIYVYGEFGLGRMVLDEMNINGSANVQNNIEFVFQNS